ncbi:ATP-dependent DNA ligase [Gordonia neofelifaecis]|uniref:DNA ligase n=1 Tax=Gordonia neofelifaecis NRRL B-59395 TaxID=644548 RepID=F1YNK4_9ACTN|nr:ATP-dependent DNA ligase [Gordonia neofelifaecis]EGD53741.1 ATP-dependent DNA ligase [Gordonia neofelifaecis NRRL B-59395]
MRLAAIVATATDVASTRSRTAKKRRLAELLAAVAPSETRAVVGLLLGRPIQGRIGVGWRTAHAVRTQPAADSTLTVSDVDRAFTEVAAAAGRGAAQARAATLESLMRRATVDEQDYLIRVLTAEMRTGALEGVLTDAAADAAGVPPSEVRRAAMLSGDLGSTVRAALAGEDLGAVDLTPGIPVAPMLAGTAGSAAEAVAGMADASVEVKLDGARIQVHRVRGEVAVYTRSLADVTVRVPEIVALVSGFSGGDLVLDGETLALDASGAARPFQETMSRFGMGAGDVALSAWFFDALYAEGRSLIDEPLRRRREVLSRLVGERRIRGIEVAGGESAARADDFFRAAVAGGDEGVVVKSLDSPYTAGRRGSQWIKVKPVYTYDLVVLAVEQGSGRRRGLLSNLHLGARDPDGRYGPPGGFVMVGKTFKGLTDEVLRWQTDYFPTIATGEAGHVLNVRPETVVEVAIDGVQRSSRYPGGVALRFARVKRYRTGVDGKPAVDADTIDVLQSLPGARSRA